MISQTGGRNHSSEITALNRANEFNKLMNYFWNNFDYPLTASAESSLNDMEPHIQIAETKEAVNVTAELPGIEEKDLDLQISSDGYLTICGEKKNKFESTEKDSYFSEITYGTFKRSVPLPWDLDYEKAAADYQDGVLKVMIPKSQVEKQKFKKLSINKNKTKN